MRSALDALGITEAVDMFGWSYGGLIALDFALNHPERIRCLALAEPPAFWVLGDDDTQEASAREMLAILRTFGPRSEITDDQIERFRCAVGNCPVGRSIRDDPRWPTWLQERAHLRGLAAIVSHRDDPARLRGFRRPVLIVTGTTTVAFHRRINDVLAAHMPNARRAELPGGHASVIAGVDRCVDALLAFLPPRP